MIENSQEGSIRLTAGIRKERLTKQQDLLVKGADEG
jgi:hypothetical protein